MHGDMVVHSIENEPILSMSLFMVTGTHYVLRWHWMVTSQRALFPTCTMPKNFIAEEVVSELVVFPGSEFDHFSASPNESLPRTMFCYCSWYNNCRIYHNLELVELVEDAGFLNFLCLDCWSDGRSVGCLLLFLPPYYLDLSPIQESFSTCKYLLSPSHIMSDSTNTHHKSKHIFADMVTSCDRIRIQLMHSSRQLAASHQWWLKIGSNTWDTLRTMQGSSTNTRCMMTWNTTWMQWNDTLWKW